MTKTAIMTAIRTAGLSETDLLAINRDLIDLIKFNRREECHKAGANFSVGDSVSFRNRDGGITSGTLTKINRKNGKVKVGFTTWTVPMNVLNAVRC